MSWFDKLFGEDNDSNDDLIHRKKKRRQESQNIDNDHDSLLPQNNDIYSRPRGKFRFPMSVAYENENVEQSADTISDEKEQYHRDYRKQSHDSRSQKRHRRRRNQTTEEQNYSEQRGNSKISQQSIKYKDHSHYHTNKPGTYVSAINGIEKETHKPKTHNMYSNNTNHRAKDSTPDYHKESFKTSEVPSAIFGTMKPKKLENGRIPVSKPSEKVESDKQKYDKYVAKTQTSQNKQLEQENKMIVLSNKELHLNHLMKMYHQQQNQCLIIQKLIILSKLKIFMLHKLLKKLDVNENVKCFKSVDLKKRCNKSVKNIKTKSKMQYNVQLMKCMLNKRNAMLVIVH